MGLTQRLTAARDALFPRALDPGRALEQQLAPQAAFGESMSVSDNDGWIFRALGGGTKTDAGAFVSEYTAITLPVVYACVSLIADNLAMLPVQVRRRRPGGGSDDMSDHPIHRLLNSEPNDESTAYVQRQTQQSHALLWGNGYAEIERNRRGDPLGLWLLYPDRTHPYKEANKPLVFKSSVNGQQITLNPADVIHIPAMGFDGFRGYSPITIARNAVGMGLAMEKFGGKFFANDSKSGGFLLHPGKLGDKGRTNVRDSFQEQGGPDDAFKVKVLEEGMKFLATTINPDDAQFLGSREFQVAEIARMFRVPLVLLQAMEKSTSWGSGIEQMMIGFVVWTIQPWVERWEQELERKLLTEAERAAGFYIKFNLNALLRGDMKARGQFYKDLYGIGSLNPNEVRELEDRNPYDGGDEFRVPLNMAEPGEEPEDAEEDETEDEPPPALAPEQEDA